VAGFVTRLTDELRALKDQGVEWDTAWTIATAHSGKHFKPTALDDGRDGPREEESMARFQYRTARACYLDVGSPCAISRDTDNEGDGHAARGRSRRAA
jgi:hypothetical protein